MMSDWSKLVALVLAVALSATSCSSSTNLAEGGIGGTGISMGSVTAVGSIWVNGVEYDTTGANIIFADDGTRYPDTIGSAGGSILFPGMVVTVEGNINGVKGSATTVTYADTLEGPIESAPAANSLVVLGQKVNVDYLTKFRGGVVGISGLVANNVVEVSGFRDAAGNIRATYIEKKYDNFVDGAAEIELKGIISAVDSGASTITIGNQVVDISNATKSGFAVEPVINDFVEAKGSSFVSGNVLVATALELKSSVLDTKDQDIAEMEGIVTAGGATASEFMLNGQIVRFDEPSTVFNGGLPTDIVLGAKLEVEGSLMGGVVIADEITFKDNVELEANIQSIDVINNTTTVTLEGLGLTVQYDAKTVFEGIVSPSTDLKVGQHVEILARKVSNGLLAQRIKVSPPPTGETAIMLYGPVDSLNSAAGTVTVLNIVGGPFLEFEVGSLATRPDETTFFKIVKENDMVELNGTWNDGLSTWKSIELDN